MHLRFVVTNALIIYILCCIITLFFSQIFLNFFWNFSIFKMKCDQFVFVVKLSYDLYLKQHDENFSWVLSAYFKALVVCRAE
jgi:hypothetical protein